MDKKYDNSHRESTGAVLEGLEVQSYCFTYPHRRKQKNIVHIEISQGICPDFYWEIHVWMSFISYTPSERIYCN